MKYGWAVVFRSKRHQTFGASFLCPVSPRSLHRGRELGPSGHEAAGAPDAVPPLAPTMSLTTRGRRGTPQLYAHPSGGNSPQLSPFALAREPGVPATRSILRLLRPSAPTPGPGDPHATLIPKLDRDSLAALTRNRHSVHSCCQRGKLAPSRWAAAGPLGPFPEPGGPVRSRPSSLSRAGGAL